MKDFINFEKFVKENQNKIIFDTLSNLQDVSESQQTISKEEWNFIQKLIVNSNLAFLRQYHQWLNS